MKKLTLLGACVSVVVSATAFADVVQWIGTGEVACWTNAANWAGGVVPGRYVGPDGTETGTGGSSVTFTVGANDQTIDLDGCISVGNVLVTGNGAGKFTFGTAKTQSLRLETGCTFTVDATVCTSPEILAGAGSYTMKSDAGPQVYFANESLSATLILNDVGHALIPDKGTAWTSRKYQVKGAGTIRIQGSRTNVDGLDLEFGVTRLVIAGSLRVATFKINSPKARQTIDIETGAKLTVGSYGGNGLWLETSKGVDIVGGGELDVVGGRYSSSNFVWVNGQQLFGSSSDTKIACAIFGGTDDGVATNVTGQTSVGLRMYGSGTSHNGWSSGTVYMKALDCRLAGYVELYNATWAHVDSLGLKGEQGSFGWCTNFYLMNNARIVYEGSGETTDRDLHIGRHPFVKVGPVVSKPSAEFAAFEIEQAGTGPLVVQSTLDCTEADVTPKLTLVNDTQQPAVWASDLTLEGLSVAKTGSGAWTLSGANAYTGATIISDGKLVVERASALASSSGIELAGGMLEIPASEDATAVELKGLTVSANSRLDVGLGNALTFSSLTVASGRTLAIVTADDATIVKVAGQSAGPATGVTLNGVPAHYNDMGELVGDGTAWKRPDSGSWHDSANWTDGLPSSGKATRINVSGDLTVGVHAAAATGDFFMKNGTGKTVLAVSNEYSTAGTSVTLERGAELLVGEGGRVSWSGLASLSVVNGGGLTVDGGELAIFGTTAAETITSSDPSRPTVLATRAGTFYHEMPSGGQPLTLGPGARFEMTGGTNVFEWASWYRNFLSMTGGERHAFGGDAVLNFKSTNCGAIYCDGTFAFSDHAAVITNGHHSGGINVTFSPATADGAFEMDLTDEAKFDSLGFWIMLGCPLKTMPSDRVTSRLVFDSTAYSRVQGLWAGIERTSVAEIEMKRGSLEIGSYGINLGTSWESYWCDASRARGVFKMTGGSVTTSGLGYSGYNYHLLGIAVGNGVRDGRDNRTNYRYSARFELDGGAVTNTLGFFVVGAGRADGEFIQRGGELCYADNWNSQHYPCPQIVGAFTGSGFYAVSNGVSRFNTGMPMYVGGVTTNDLKYTGHFGTSEHWTNMLQTVVKDRLAATGKVEVVDGELTSAGDLILGADGRGEIAIVGSKGAANFANAVFSNRVESVASFTLDADGVAPLALAGTLTVTDGATLNVDVSRYEGKSARTRLVTCAAMEGRFATVNLTGTDASETLKDATVVQGDAGVYLRIPRGALLLVR